MTDHDAFLAAIIARPDDDLPRLVYADYLDEQADADRAEFVRVQCELARLPADDPARPALAEREQELLSAHGRRWKVPFGVKSHQVFRRGFVESVGIRADNLLAHGARLFAAAPVRELRVYQLGVRFDAFVHMPELARIETLDLTNSEVLFFTGTGLGQLLNEGRLERLRRLVVRNNSLWATSLQTIARSPVGPRLASLDVSGNRLGDEGARVLAGEPGFAGLTELVARNDEIQYVDSIHGDGATALARSETLTRLKHLDLRGHYIGDAGVARLVESPIAAGLESLDVSDNEIGVVGESAFEAIAGSRHLGALRYLYLDSSKISRLAAKALVGWPRLEADARVELRDCDFGPGALETILESPFAGQFQLDVPAESVG